jgi:hypothetical protein|tara:strand:- start:268 stop:1098 length:831 start_codon:yes stop_codon:yes gene_type:complete
MAFKLGGKSGLPMKRSGFKMRTSPFNRNMGIGVSPVKNLGNFIDGERVGEEEYNEFLAEQKALKDERSDTYSEGGATDEQFTKWGVEKPMSHEEWAVKNNPEEYELGSDGRVYTKGTDVPVGLGGDADYVNYTNEQHDKVTDAIHTAEKDATFTEHGDDAETDAMGMWNERAQATGDDWFAQKRLEHEQEIKDGSTDIYDFNKYIDEYHADDAFKQGLYSKTKEGKADTKSQELKEEREDIVDADTEGETIVDKGNTYGEFDELFKPGTAQSKIRR